MKQRPMRGIVPAVLLALGCAAPPESERAEPSSEPPPQPASQQAPRTLEEARARIDSVIGDAAASTLSECALAPLGVRPCGGPRAYLAYSTAETDSAALRALLAVYERLDRERNEAQGLVSTCELMLPPDLALENGRCVTR
jgi:hypothetical protein